MLQPLYTYKVQLCKRKYITAAVSLCRSGSWGQHVVPRGYVGSRRHRTGAHQPVPVAALSLITRNKNQRGRVNLPSPPCVWLLSRHPTLDPRSIVDGGTAILLSVLSGRKRKGGWWPGQASPALHDLVFFTVSTLHRREKWRENTFHSLDAVSVGILVFLEQWVCRNASSPGNSPPGCTVNKVGYIRDEALSEWMNKWRKEWKKMSLARGKQPPDTNV